MEENSKIQGYWKIIWMEEWDQDFVDMEVPGYVLIPDEGYGEFQFGLVKGSFSVDPDKRSFWSQWEGFNEMDEDRGEIDGKLKNGELLGTISFWSGDKSNFRATSTKKAMNNLF